MAGEKVVEDAFYEMPARRLDVLDDSQTPMMPARRRSILDFTIVPYEMPARRPDILDLPREISMLARRPSVLDISPSDPDTRKECSMKSPRGGLESSTSEEPNKAREEA